MNDKKDKVLKLALDALDCIYSPLHVREINKVGAAMSAIRAALAEQPAQQQEPYGWKVYGVSTLFTGKFAEDDAKAEAKLIGGTCIAFPLYTSKPASKPWVGLTDEDIGAACGFGEHTTASTRFTLMTISRAIEAKLRDKNT